jgi:hypothetical protein
LTKDCNCVPKRTNPNSHGVGHIVPTLLKKKAYC